MTWYAIDPETGDLVGVEHPGVAETLREGGWDVRKVATPADARVEAEAD